MASRITDKERATTSRGTDSPNPGTFLGTEARAGFLYARYKAKRGTWVSASLSQLGYDKLYGSDVAHGAYLGVALGPDYKPLSNPDKIEPGQEYLIPVGTAVSFDVPDYPKHAFRDPVVRTSAKESWQQGRRERWLKDRFLAARNFQDYPSFELQGGPKPPSKVPREAVAFWLRSYRRVIIRAEGRWRVSRLAIAGAIAWEALENPQAWSVSSVSVAKMHLTGKKSLLDVDSWPDWIEWSGRLPRRTLLQRVAVMQEPEMAIWYIGAALDLAAELAERRGWNIRNSPEVLLQIYHAYSPREWAHAISTKPVDSPFDIVPGEMSTWILQNRQYLESAVGPPMKIESIGQSIKIINY